MNFDLDVEQQIAVKARGGPWAVIASPGSGKTAVIAARFIELLKSGISPDDILTLTFTDQAAKNMGERAGFGSTQSVFRTFHSYCLSVLRKERQHLSYALRPEIIGLQPDIFELVCEICRIHNNRLKYKDIVDAVSYYKMRSISPEQAIDEACGVDLIAATAYRDYEKKSKERGWLDFDSLIIEAVKLLESNDEVCNRNQFVEVQTDEFQDTDANQLRLLKLITRKHGAIFCVGDENQLIFEWRSAAPGSLSNFHQHFPGAQKLFLGRNYRSTKRLVAFFKRILPTDNGIATHMTAGPNAEEGYDPTITKYKDDTEEMDKVLAAVTDNENTAILARTNRQLWRFENTCIRKNIKYRLLGKTGFWDQGETKKLVELVKEHKGAPGPAGPIVKRVIEQSGLINKYRVPFKFGQKNPEENINDAYIVATRFNNIDDFIKHVNKATHAHRNRSGMMLSTVHQIKGKEANHVFLTGVSQGLLPHDKGELAEEKRIFFVACTRAAKFLHMSYSGMMSQFISPFMTEFETLEQQRNKIPGAQKALF